MLRVRNGANEIYFVFVYGEKVNLRSVELNRRRKMEESEGMGCMCTTVQGVVSMQLFPPSFSLLLLLFFTKQQREGMYQRSPVRRWRRPSFHRRPPPATLWSSVRSRLRR